MGVVVIVAFRPHPGKAVELIELTREHVPILRAEGLATSRAAVILQASEGVVVEIFEWESEEAMQRAHHLPAIQDLWDRFGTVCEFASLASLPECAELFASFKPVASNA